MNSNTVGIITYNYSLSRIISVDTSAKSLLKLPDLSDKIQLTALLLQIAIEPSQSPTMNNLHEAIEAAVKFGEAHVTTKSHLNCYLIKSTHSNNTIIHISFEPSALISNSFFPDSYLFEKDNLFKLLFEQASVGVVIRDVNTEEIYQINDKYLEIIGKTREEVGSLKFRNITVETDQKAHDELDLEMKLGRSREYSVEKRYKKEDGSIVWALVTCRAIWLPGQRPNAIIAIAQDITETKIPQLLNEFIASKSSFDSGKVFMDRLVEFVSELLNFSFVSVFTVDSDTQQLKCEHSSSQQNSQFVLHVGFLLADNAYSEQVEPFCLGNECIGGAISTNESSGIFQWIRNEMGLPIGLIAIHLTETVTKKLSWHIIQSVASVVKVELINNEYQREIWHQANFDPLTNIPNRRLIKQKLNDEVKKHKRDSNRRGALLLLDLDEFKVINDSRGHALGDVLLQNVSARLKSIIREVDILGRLGGDEFIIFLDDVDSVDAIVVVSEKILQSLSNKFLIEDNEFYIGCSIGIALIPDDATNAVELLSRADQAMYESKAAGKNRFSFYRKSMNAALKRKSSLVQQLRLALNRNEIYLEYQPIVDVEHDRFSSAEVLLRWHNEEFGQISPAEFVPIAEQAGIMPDLSNWAFQEACAALEIIRKKASNFFRFNFNKSAVEFRSEILKKRYNQKYLTFLSKHQLGTDAIVIELTENIFIDKSTGAVNAVNELFELGFELAIDDFGTGYSSLSYLRSFPVGTLKIDRTFIEDIDAKESDERICRAIIAMCKSLGIKTVAEGVETREQADKLLNMGVDYLQGFLFARPMSLEKIVELLSSSKQVNISKAEERFCKFPVSK